MTWAAIGRAIWAKLWPAVAALLLLSAFAAGSILLGYGGAVLGSVAEWLTTVGHVPPLLLVASPLLLAGWLGWLNRSRPLQAATTRLASGEAVPLRPVPMLATDAAPKHEDDPTWYSSDWRRDPDNPDHELGTAGYRLELQGGPLAGRTARLRDSRFRLWVLRDAGGELAVRGAVMLFADDVPDGARSEGFYSFSHGDEAMVWRAAE